MLDAGPNHPIADHRSHRWTQIDSSLPSHGETADNADGRRLHRNHHTIAVCPQMTLTNADDVATTKTQRHQDSTKKSQSWSWCCCPTEASDCGRNHRMAGRAASGPIAASTKSSNIEAQRGQLNHAMPFAMVFASSRLCVEIGPPGSTTPPRQSDTLITTHARLKNAMAS